MGDSSKPSDIPNVFGLNQPQHMLTKLYVEIMRLTDSLSVWTKNEAFPEPLFLAFNTAVTAWHMTDWLWESNATTRDRLSRIFSFTYKESTVSGRKAGLTRFQDAVAQNCRDLHICREIANGSKHMRRRKPDPDIRAAVEWDPVTESVGEAKVGDLVMSLSVYDKGEKTDAVLLFIDAAGYWEHLLTREKWISEEHRLPERIIKAVEKLEAQRAHHSQPLAT